MSIEACFCDGTAKNRLPINLLTLFAIWISFAGLGMADEPALSRPVAIAVSSVQPYAYIANQGNSSIIEVNTESCQARQIQGNWNGLTDLILEPNNNILFAASSSPPQIHEISITLADNEVGRSIGLPGEPNRMALSNDGRSVCVSMTWMHAVCLLPLQDERLQEASTYRVLPLFFQPKEVLAIDSGKFLVADAFGGHLAVVDASTAKVVASHKILGHHIGALARDDSTKSVAITHQRISAVAQTNRDDIHWGALMQNVVSVIPESAFTTPNANLAKSTQRSMLGVVGNGAADPSGIVGWNGSLYVAITGTDKIAFRDNPKEPFSYMEIEQPPTQLARLSDDKILWISTLGNSAGFMERVGNRLELRNMLGNTKKPMSPEERGELAFFSGKLTHDGWMSCSSCHVNGHSPDLLADTQGDGRFDSPKRIPSLLNVASTSPWTWNGNQSSLEHQIEKTLATTMHRDDSERDQSESDPEVAKNLAAYLRTLRLPTSKQVDGEELQRGRSLFHDRGCARCHQPELQYTSPDTYDVGLVDEAGETKFNPPSLNGLRHRGAFLHDARYRSLDELLQVHPDSKIVWTVQELADIKVFLMSL